MRYLVLSLLISLSVFASEVETQLQKKSENYTVLRKYYSNLLANVNIQNDQHFCSNVKNAVPVLYKIFEDDQALVRALRTSQDVDFREYAQQIEDNSYSPLFSSTAYHEFCDANNRETILRLGQSLQYHVMNIDYLSMSNLLFWESISGQVAVY